jgi:hypothetical protein
MTNNKITMLLLAALMAGALAAAGCKMDDDEPGANKGADIVDINFSDISATATQEQVTGTIKSSLELLQAQTQNIINKLTEYEATLRQELQALMEPGIGTPKQRNEIIAKINVVENIIDYENQIKSAQQDQSTETGLNNMSSHYDSITKEIAKLFENSRDRQILTAKMSTYQEAVSLDERNIIDPAEKLSKLNALDSSSKKIIMSEEENGNSDYFLPSPETNMSGVRSRLGNESKQAFGGQNTLGDYGQYIFYQGEDIAAFKALLLDAKEIGKETFLP